MEATGGGRAQCCVLRGWMGGSWWQLGDGMVMAPWESMGFRAKKSESRVAV